VVECLLSKCDARDQSLVPPKKRKRKKKVSNKGGYTHMVWALKVEAFNLLKKWVRQSQQWMEISCKNTVCDILKS
jgi:hypothetical protein